jgi:hypothetical protein
VTSRFEDGGCAVPTTTGRPVTEIADYIGGFVAAEGCFHVRPSNGGFSFTVSLGASDEEMIELLHEFFGCGFVTRWPRRRPHYDDEATLTVKKLRDLVEVMVPFMDAHLPRSYKLHQYVAWRAELLRYWTERAVRTCSAPGCNVTRRGEGLCGAHRFLYGR